MWAPNLLLYNQYDYWWRYKGYKIKDKIVLESSNSCYIMTFLTDNVFKIGAYGVLSESQNSTSGCKGYPPFWQNTQTKYLFIPALDFLLLAKICLKTTANGKTC